MLRVFICAVSLVCGFLTVGCSDQPTAPFSDAESGFDAPGLPHTPSLYVSGASETISLDHGDGRSSRYVYDLFADRRISLISVYLNEEFIATVQPQWEGTVHVGNVVTSASGEVTLLTADFQPVGFGDQDCGAGECFDVIHSIPCGWEIFRHATNSGVLAGAIVGTGAIITVPGANILAVGGTIVALDHYLEGVRKLRDCRRGGDGVPDQVDLEVPAPGFP
jgi:hypothetical protein